MTAGSRPFGVGKRVLSGVAAGAIAVPISFGMMGTAFAFNGNQNATPPAAIGTNTACPPSQVTNQGFTDITGADNSTQINCLGDYGITKGTTATTYSPTRGVLRANMAAFIYRLGKDDPSLTWDTSDAGFQDIGSQPQEFKDAINALANAGVVSGVDATHFAPGRLVTREQMSKFISLILAKITGSTANPNQGKDYFDDDDQSIFEPYINAIAGLGIAVGDGVSKYNPGNNVTRQQMASFIARTLEVGVEQNKIPNKFSNVVALSVTPSTQTANAGGNAALTITGQNITAYSTTGSCTSGASQSSITPPANNASQTINVTVPISSSATGSCTLTTTVTYKNGQTQSTTNTVTISTTPTGVTTRPELVQAQILQTVTAGQATPTNPAGTTIRYTFDEALNSVQVPGNFHVYNFSTPNAPVSAASGSVESANTKAVDAFFPTLTTSTSTSNLSVATVDFGAVIDTTGVQNPIGNAALTPTSGTPSANSPGVTTAPDLLTVGRFGAAASGDTQSAVDFTFDQAAFVQGTGGFHLLSTTGAITDCTVSPTSGFASGGSQEGGQGTTTITALCGPFGAATAPSASNVARGYDDTGAVSSASTGGVLNPNEASNSPHAASPAPDLVSVTFQPGAGTASDVIVYTFDQTVTAANQANFGFYNANGTVTTGGTSATVNSANTTQVAVTFANGALANAVGGFVTAGGATGSGVGGVGIGSNAFDEMAPATLPTGTTTGATAGATAGPDLTGVALSATKDVFGNTTGYTATYTFDEALTGPVTSTDFFLLLSDGTRLQCASGAAIGASSTSTPSNSQVTCSTWTIVGGGTPTTTQVGSAVLGTVDNGAIFDASANQNPEGAKATTGGTGTPAQ